MADIFLFRNGEFIGGTQFREDPEILCRVRGADECWRLEYSYARGRNFWMVWNGESWETVETTTETVRDLIPSHVLAAAKEWFDEDDVY